MLRPCVSCFIIHPIEYGAGQRLIEKQRSYQTCFQGAEHGASLLTSGDHGDDSLGAAELIDADARLLGFFMGKLVLTIRVTAESQVEIS